jgi:hypothetical protein
MRIPKNIIQTNKYTSGKEFVYKLTQTPYQGYYYILNNLFYIGKEYNQDAPELIKITQSNTLLYNSKTAIFSVISGISSQFLKIPKIKSIQSNIESNSIPVRYFSQQINIQPILIKEISKETYESIQEVSLYKTTFIGNYNGNIQTLDQADKQMPGLKSFLLG